MERRERKSISRSHSQEVLDSSSASSVSVFAEHSDGQNNRSLQKAGENSPRASMDEALKSEAAFIQYLSSIPPSERPLSADPGAPPKVGLDHLDHLCKLMEQLSELRDTNGKLQKRVQYLEDLKTLHDMHREICESEEAAEKQPPCLIPLQKSATESSCPRRRYLSRRGRQPVDGGHRRGRSKSVGHEDLNEDSKSRRLFPKWSRVKEALGWESERKNSLKAAKSDSGNNLSIRRRSDDSSRRHPSSRTWYQNYPSIHSSVEDIHEDFEGRWKKLSAVSEKLSDHLDIPHEALRRQKSTPSPGGDTADPKPKSFTIERDSCLCKFERDDGKRGKSPWGRVKTIIERHRDSIKRRSLRQEADLLPFGPFKDDAEEGEAVAPRRRANKPGPISLEPQEVEQGCPRTPNSSPVLQRKSKWTRMTKALKGRKEGSSSTPTSPNNPQDGHFTFDAIDELSPGSLDEEISRVGSVPHLDIMLHLQRNLSEDFHRKILEWDRMQRGGDHKKSGAEKAAVKPKVKDLTWLEKELQKVEKEKRRLSSERIKNEQRALRLEKLRETVLSSKREVLVKTSAGEFRFEGISDAFTKKLYEWETKRGVGLEYSTIALLNSSRMASSGGGTMQRMLSKSESSIADIGLHSSHSLSPSAKMSDSAEGQNHLSRADSEPDLSTLAAAFGGNLSAAVSIPEEMAVGQPKDSDEELEKEEFGLLEENVLLLERLKEKEEICRRLQKDLEILDEKMEEMSVRHTKETQRYREKLWELHRASPREVLCCRRTMQQLQKRIEALENWTSKLRSERDTVEVNFRIHSKEQESMTLDLLERMRELQAVGSSNEESESRPFSRMDADTVERLQDLSTRLSKQTRDLQETLVRKTGQIRQLKWELLHRDLSTVKMETERHSHSAAKKRSKYGRSRSSEEPPPPQKTDTADGATVTPDALCLSSSSVEEFQATDLLHTVQRLTEEVQKLAPVTKVSQDEKMSTSATPNDTETPRSHKKTPAKPVSKRITVRRNSADNSSLLSTDDNRLRDERSSSDDSSDEYYSRFCCRKENNIPNSSEAERLLMSYGENPPRMLQRKKKLQKVSKLNSSLGRRRSNTFHTNRDLQKPLMGENAPQKCHSFRVPRENYNNEESAVIKTPYFRRKLLQAANYSARTHSDNNTEVFREADLLRREAAEGGVLIREAASDSKIPLIPKERKLPVRSMSDKTAAATEKENLLQKKRAKRRLKAPNGSATVDAIKSDVSESFSQSQILNSLDKEERKSKGPQSDIRSFRSQNSSLLKQMEPSKREQEAPQSDIRSFRSQNSSLLKQMEPSKREQEAPQSDIRSFRSQNSSLLKQTEPSKREQEAPQSDNRNDRTEIPTVTIQFPKRKPRKQLSVHEEAVDVTIVVPKKRSLSSECDSSISESSPREETRDHSDKTKNSSDPSSADPLSLSSNTRNTDSIGSIQLMKLVSLDSFENPYEGCKISVPKDHKQNESQVRKRKAQDGEAGGKNSPTEEMIDMINAGLQHGLAKSSTTAMETSHSENTPVSANYIKSPSAPQLDWRKGCAKKISRTGAPNVRTLIERYNQKVIETQTGKSPSSSNVSSPTALRKTSTTPVHSPQQYVPHFSSTPSTPTIAPSYSSLVFPNSPPSSPLSVARSEALRRAREQFIASPQLSPVARRTCDSRGPEKVAEKTTSDEDRMSHGSMDSMNLVMLRAGESCRESRQPKKSSGAAEPPGLKVSKSLSSSSLFKTVLHSDFRVPANLLKLKRSKRKKDMSAVTELCRQSLLLTSEEAPNPAATSSVSHKSCPSSPELKSKTANKPNWLQRNIFRQK